MSAVPYVAVNCVIKIGASTVVLAEKISISEEYDLKKKYVFGRDAPYLAATTKTVSFTIERPHPENDELLKQTLNAKSAVNVVVYPKGIGSGKPQWTLTNVVFHGLDRDASVDDYVAESVEGEAEDFTVGTQS